MQLLPGPLSFVMSVVSLVSMSIKLMLSVPLLSAPILSFLENRFTVTRFASRSLLKLLLVSVTGGLCILLKTNAVLVIELLGAVPQNFTCIVMPCAALLKLRRTHLTVLQQGILFTLALVFAGYGEGNTISIIAGL